MSKYILVSCKYSNIKGLYKLVDKNSYTKLDEKISIYKLYNKHWVLGVELNSNRFYTIVENSNVNDPLELKQWTDGSNFITLSHYQVPVIKNNILAMKQNTGYPGK